jgi:hypothetical protein
MTDSELDSNPDIRTTLTLLQMDATPTEKWKRIRAIHTKEGFIRGFQTTLSLSDGTYNAQLWLPLKLLKRERLAGFKKLCL